jgi:alkylmercury lyase
MTDFLDGLEAFLQSFSPDEAAVSRAAFRELLSGRPTRVESLSVAVGLPAPVVERAVARLVERGTMARDAATGEIVGTRGLSLTETPHALVLDGRRLYAFCAVDAVGIPAALGLDARVESRCHVCRRPLTLTFTEGAVTEATPGVVIWAAERDLTRPLHSHT